MMVREKRDYFLLLRPYYITPKVVRRQSVLLPIFTVTAIATVMYIIVAGLV